MKLVSLPAGIDSHVHFRTPGASWKEDWKSGAKAALNGGITTVLDMPNTSPSTTTIKRLSSKKQLIEAQLQEVGIPLRFGLYIGATKEHLDELIHSFGNAAAIKLFMGSSTGTLLVEDKKLRAEIFRIAAKTDQLVAVHAEEESFLRRLRPDQANQELSPQMHSEIRCREAAIEAVTEAIDLAIRHGTRLHLLHLSTKEEMELVRQAKKSSSLISTEVCPHHLFLDVRAYEQYGTRVVMNPPLRQPEDCEALLDAVVTGVVDTIGSDHAPHTKEEKAKPYPKTPAGVPGVETLLPLLLHLVSEKKLTLSRLVELFRKNPQRIFRLPDHEDRVIVDLDRSWRIDEKDLFTKAAFSPFSGTECVGVPVSVILRGKEIPIHRRAGESKELFADRSVRWEEIAEGHPPLPPLALSQPQGRGFDV